MKETSAILSPKGLAILTLAFLSTKGTAFSYPLTFKLGV